MTKQSIGEEVVPRVSIAMTPSEAIILVLARNSDISLPQILKIITQTKMWKDANSTDALKEINRLVHHQQVESSWNEEKRQCVYRLNIESMI